MVEDGVHMEHMRTSVWHAFPVDGMRDGIKR